jgi:hypothetical protein
MGICKERKMSAILGALTQGYSAKHIVQYLQKNFPSLKSPIAKAISQGYAADKILDFLSNNHLDEAREQGATPNELQAIRRKGYNKNFARAAGAAASFVPFGAIARGLTSASSAALPQNPQIGNQPATPIPPIGPQGGPGPGPQPMANAPVHPPSAQQANVAQASQAMPTQQTQPFDPIGQDPEFKAFAQAQIDKGNVLSPESMKIAFKAQKERESRKSPLMKGIDQASQGIFPETPKKTNEFLNATGDLGTIKSERNGKALFDVEGKLHEVKKDDLIELPENIKNKDYESIAKSYFDTFPKEGEGSLSDALSVMAYDPESRTLVASFPDSPHSIYSYENVEPELYEEIISASTAPKTSGGTGLPGTWDVNVADSRGSPFKKISSNKDKYPFKKLTVGYNMWGNLANTLKEMRKQQRRKPK